jgi:hypothetical protein
MNEYPLLEERNQQVFFKNRTVMSSTGSTTSLLMPMPTQMKFICHNCPPEHLQPFFSERGHTDLKSSVPSLPFVALTGKFPSNLPI